jgi:RNA polymerase sigma factor (sigma-70 family)
LDGDDEPSREVLARIERDHETAAPTITHLDIAGPREIALIREAQAGMRADDALKHPLDPAKARELRGVSLRGRVSCNTLLTAHDKLVRMYARRYYSAAGTRHGLDFDDMLQEARRGFLWGVTKFKVESGTKLSTYASFWMQQCMGRALDKTRSLVTLPYNVIELAKRAGKKGLVTEETLQAAGGGKRTLHPEIAQAAAMVWSGRDLSVNEQVGGGGEDDDESSALRVAGYLQSDEDVEERVVEADHQARRAAFAREALATLTEREQVVVQRRLMTDPPDSLDEVGRAIGVSRERVRQMEQEATAKMRVALCKLATANDLAAEVLEDPEDEDGETAAAA